MESTTRCSALQMNRNTKSFINLEKWVPAYAGKTIALIKVGWSFAAKETSLIVVDVLNSVVQFLRRHPCRLVPARPSEGLSFNRLEQCSRKPRFYPNSLLFSLSFSLSFCLSRTSLNCDFIMSSTLLKSPSASFSQSCHSPS